MSLRRYRLTPFHAGLCITPWHRVTSFSQTSASPIRLAAQSERVGGLRNCSLLSVTFTAPSHSLRFLISGAQQQTARALAKRCLTRRRSGLAAFAAEPDIVRPQKGHSSRHHRASEVT